jgi:WD40 repeat protein
MDSNPIETILIFAANPIGQQRLRLDKEVREIQNGLRHSRKKFNIEQQWATRPEELRRALLDYKPAYVHFCGHGSAENGIVLEDHFVEADALAGLFALFSSTIRCVVLNACYSAVQARVIARHIDFVVGMNKGIGDEAAIEFATAFYDALGAGESIDFAYALGCNAIQLAGIPEYLTPALLTRSASGRTTDTLPEALPSSRHDWDGAPDVSMLFGREVIAELLKSWILDDLCRIVLITGLGGIGKTDLATCIGRGGNRALATSPTLAHGIHNNFECVLWRSLLNAPLPQDFFADILAVLSDHSYITHSPPLQQVSAILASLQMRRCLLILDNVEALLKPGDPSMRYRDGYEAYGLFFEHIGKMAHKSCLLLTSREKPKVVAELEGIRRPVRSISLDGIGKAESQQLFSQIGSFTGSDPDWDQIVKLYHGNPLALELAARHIDQVFDGSLTAFLAGGRSVFSDLQELLDWHLDRLSEAESEIVYWLAIEREPVSLATLYDDLVSPTSREHITSTLQSLQRRIPLERAVSQHFALQPVLIEHITARLVDQAGFEFQIERPEPTKLVRDPLPGSVHPEMATGRLQLLSSHSLVKATAKENVRESQRRLILDPVAQRLARFRDNRELGAYLLNLLTVWRRERGDEPGYTAGNIINVLSHLKIDVSYADLSRLRFWQACLDDVNLHATDFSFSEFRRSTFRHAFGPIFSLCYSPDGAFIAAGDDNGEVRLFHAANGQLFLRCVGHSDVVSGIAFSPDGKTIASASFDHTIRLWRASDGQCENMFLGHESWVLSLAFSPDGEVLASCGEDATVRLWSLRTSKSRIPVALGTGFVATVAFSPDSELLAYGGGAKTVIVLRLSDLKCVAEFSGHLGRIRALAFSPDGSTLASGAEDALINFWHLGIDKPVATLSGHSGPIRALSFRSQGDLLASASDDKTVRLWNTATEDCVGSFQASASRVWSVSFSPGGDTLASGGEDSTIRVWDSEYCDCLMTLRGYGNKVLALAFGSDPTLLVSGSEDRVVRIWDTLTAQPRLELRGHSSRIWSVACSADMRWVASASDDLSVRVWDLHTQACRFILHGHDDWVRTIAFHAESSLLASAGEDDKINIWELDSGSCRVSIEGGMVRIFSMAFCKQTSWLVAAGADKRVRVFSSIDGRFVGDLRGHHGPINAVFCCGGSRIASCSEDGTIKLWDLDHLECVATLDVGHKVWAGAPCCGGQSLVSGSDDGVLRLWNLSTGICEAEVKAHQGSIWTLAVSADDKSLASAGDDGAIRLWRLPDMEHSPTPITLRPPRPYEGMNITGASGLTTAQREALVALGAIDMPFS